MKPVFDHGSMTDLVLSRLQQAIDAGVSSSAKPLVGDGVAPADGGWLQGQPGDGTFRPYTVLVSGGAVPRYLDVSTFAPDWAVSYSLRSFGGSRRQCDWMATLARKAAYAVHQGTFTGWQVIGLEWGSLGPVSRVDSTSPPFWQVFDNVTFVVCAS